MIGTGSLWFLILAVFLIIRWILRIHWRNVMNKKMGKVNTFIKRLDKLGIKLTIAANYPWIYISAINDIYVTELFRGNHGFTFAMLSARDDTVSFTDITEIFKLIRKYITSSCVWSPLDGSSLSSHDS